MMMTPMNPTMSPATPLTRIGSSARNSADRTIAKSGTGEVRMAASDESTDCSAQVMSRNGIVMLTIAMTSRWPYIRRSRGSGWWASRMTTHSSAAPTSSRSETSVNVPKSSTASLMNR